MTIRLRAVLALPLALVALGSPALHAAAPAQSAAQSATDLVAQRDEALAYAIGLQAYIYAYPALDYMKVLREQTTPGLDPHGVYGPVNTLVFQDALAEPNGFYKGRAPNNDTIYFTAWIDTSAGPVRVDAPDTKGRYYALTFADFYSNVQHTGRRTTGTAAQSVWVVGPTWQGDVPAGTHLVRLPTHRGYLLGRLLVYQKSDLPGAQALLRQFRMTGPQISAPAPSALPTAAQVRSAEAFGFINSFLRENPRVPGEEALMAQFDAAGFGPSRRFDLAGTSAATRRGLQRAAQDGHAILLGAPRAAPEYTGWSAVVAHYGQFGFDYLTRAMIEANGFLINLPAEAVYPSAITDTAGQVLDGAHRYRIVFPKGQLPPQDAFWSVTPYAIPEMDLIPNPARIYSLGNRTGPLKTRANGDTVIAVQRDRPTERDVNWLPVKEGRFFLNFRIYQPRPEVLDGSYRLPPIQRTGD